jgi:hypothetical protein
MRLRAQHENNWLIELARTEAKGHASYMSINRAKFLTAGNATFTVVSKRTGARFTYRVRASEKYGPEKLFASVLTGPDNTSDYTYLGVIEGSALRRTRASTIDRDALSFQALSWLLGHIDSPMVEFHHCGRCARCGRALTTPESIESGMGPECRSKI